MWDRRAHVAIPGGTSTLAKSTSRLSADHSPRYSARAEGAFFWDVDENRWLDFEMAMGTAIWGHAHPAITEAIVQQARNGTSFSTPDIHEVLLAEALLERFGEFTAARFLKSGADAVNAAIRIARAATARSVVMTTEYHGWGEDSVFGMYGAKGAGELGLHSSAAADTVFAAAGDADGLLATLNGVGSDLAALVLCPNRWRPQEVRLIVATAHRFGTLVIFDEVTSGQRFGKTATAGSYGVWPDVLCLSKGLASGLPLAVMLGSTDLIERTIPARVTGAHATEALAFAAAIASEEMLKQMDVWPTWQQPTNALQAQIRSSLEGRPDLELFGDHASFGLRTRGWDDFWTDPFRTRVVETFASHHIFTKGYIVPSSAHSNDAYERAAEALQQAINLAPVTAIEKGARAGVLGRAL